MPTAKQNLSFLKACLRKRPFGSKEAALLDRAEDFDAYHCPFCNKWHRTSKRHLKARLRQKKIQEKAYRKAQALRKRALIKLFYEH
jgi:hypothetical protein